MKFNDCACCCCYCYYQNQCHTIAMEFPVTYKDLLACMRASVVCTCNLKSRKKKRKKK